MRSGTLRALLRELRAGGVSEFTETSKGRTVTIRLGPEPVKQAPAQAPRKAPAKTTEPTRAELALLAELGVSKDDLNEVVSRVT